MADTFLLLWMLHSFFLRLLDSIFEHIRSVNRPNSSTKRLYEFPLVNVISAK